MLSTGQIEYERYHSPEARKARREEAEAKRDKTVTLALSLFNEGDYEGARAALFEGGISDDGIAAYFSMWHQ